MTTRALRCYAFWMVMLAIGVTLGVPGSQRLFDLGAAVGLVGLLGAGLVLVWALIVGLLHSPTR